KMILAVRNNLFRAYLSIGFQLQKGAGRLAPAGVALGHHGRSEHRGMAIQRIFNLDRRDVFTTRNHDVLAAILDLHVAIRIRYRQVAAVEPAARESLVGRLRVLQIAFHDDVAAEHDFAHGLAISGYALHGRWFHDARILLQVVRDPLARIQTRSLAYIDIGP